MAATNFGRLTPEQRREWSRPVIVPGWWRTTRAQVLDDLSRVRDGDGMTRLHPRFIEDGVRWINALDFDAHVASTDRVLPRIGVEL